MAEAFAADWLDLREPADAVSRDAALAEALVAVLPQRPTLVDLGAGTGSLFRWLAPRIGGPQAWLLVDADAALVERAFDTIAGRAVQVGLKVTAPNKRVLLVHTPLGAWRVEGRIADLADTPDRLPLERADAVVCSALLDLVSRPWLEDLADVLEVPFYAALNVDGRDRFLPPHPADGIVARGFRRDQARDKGFDGTALGAEATRFAAAAFRDRGFAVATAPSPWQLGPGQAALVAALAAGHAAAAGQRLPGRRAAIRAWHRARALQAAQGRLRATIGHRDLLALPPG
ncbi:class I SAM-dependent methyltransferase [Roseomonas sp. OT10]|uniref:class I SAM-dependent methyltransferase n=1 Tax=Roseomonas cutis TaxID=2897332 RepID=UPI001E3E2159|nr:class I SAM-dependent methyltransferase [Roseomonas sp. OT10]UFN50010.1 class I SAM-dependent methyltransferase [Roseomonas sp. OT10]